MPRMNDPKRAELLLPRIAEYEAAGLSNHKNATFARDMVGRSRRGKSFSPAQRKWVMSIIEQGIPTAADPIRHARILEAAEVPGLKVRSKDALLDFGRRVFNGWSLSAKQEKFLEGLLGEADDCAANGPWVPTPEEASALSTCNRLAARYNIRYLESHPGLYSALQKARSFCKGLSNGHTIITATLESGLDKWSVDKLFKQFKTPFAELASPKHPAGEIRFFVKSVWNVATQSNDTIAHIALVVDEPVIDNGGQIAYPVIVQGEMKNIPSDRLGKRRPKGS